MSSFPLILTEINGYILAYDRPDTDYFPVDVAFTWLPLIGLLIIFVESFFTTVIRYSSISYDRCLLALDKPTSKIDSASKFCRIYVFADVSKASRSLFCILMILRFSLGIFTSSASINNHLFLRQERRNPILDLERDGTMKFLVL